MRKITLDILPCAEGRYEIPSGESTNVSLITNDNGYISKRDIEVTYIDSSLSANLVRIEGSTFYNQRRVRCVAVYPAGITTERRGNLTIYLPK